MSDSSKVTHFGIPLSIGTVAVGGNAIGLVAVGLVNAVGLTALSILNAMGLARSVSRTRWGSSR